MYIVAFCVLFIVWYIIDYLKWRQKVLVPVQKIPGIKRYPIVGTTYIAFGVPQKDLFAHFDKYVKSMPGMFTSWNGSTPEINFKKPEYLELIMGNSVHITKGLTYKIIQPWLGEGLLISTGSKWHKHRRLITPAFHFKILENFMKVFEIKSQLLLKKLEEEEKEFFDIYPFLNGCALNIICETAMGLSSDTMTSYNSAYVNSIYQICNLIIWRMMRPYIPTALFGFLPQGREFEKHKNILHEVSDRVIAEKKELLKNRERIQKHKNLSFLDLLLQVSGEGSVLSDKDIREEVDTFMFEGHDTVTASLSWTVFLLGSHLDVQKKVFLELQEVLGDKKMPTTILELNQLKYLECVIKESLRLYPSVPIITRVAAEDMVVDGYKIPKGIQLILHIRQVHRDPEYFPDPEKFDPDRFLPENCEGRHPFCYVPFSAGPRNCIGQKFALNEAKTILASLIKNFQIESKEKPEEVQIYADLILRPPNGVLVKIKKRN